jgi:hypothetical protein
MRWKLWSAGFIAVTASAALFTACSSDTTGPDRTDSELVFARLAANAQVQTDTASFWAVKGQDRRLQIFYAPTGGSSNGDLFLEFRVDANSLLLKPNGSPFINGDSVLITVHADPQHRFIFTFEPSGLTFSPVNPAELRIRYDKADQDVDHDGDVDSDDIHLLEDLTVWQQQSIDLPWVPVPSLRIENSSEVRGTVTHFTRFALAT